MAEWSDQEKLDYLISNLGRQARRLFEKYIRKGMSEKDAALKAIGA